MECFDVVILECPKVSHENIILAVHEGLGHRKLVKKLAQRFFSTYHQFKAKAHEYINKELYMHGKKGAESPVDKESKKGTKKDKLDGVGKPSAKKNKPDEG